MSSISYIILAYVQIVVKLIRYALRGLCSVVFSGFFFFFLGYFSQTLLIILYSLD